MNLIRSLYLIATIVEVAKSSAEADDGSVLINGPFESTNLLRGSSSNVGRETRKKEETGVNQSQKRMLEVGTKRLLQLISINMDCSYDNNINDDDKTSDDDNKSDDDMTSEDDDKSDDNYIETLNPRSMFPSPTPSIAKYEDKKLFASDGGYRQMFGTSCSMSDDLVVIGAQGTAAYLFHLDGTEIMKMMPGNDGTTSYLNFGISIAMDEKIVVGSNDEYFRVFSLQGIYERTINLYCTGNCFGFGKDVATLGNLIVIGGGKKVFLYTTQGQLLKSFEQQDTISAVALSEQFIVSTSSNGKTTIYSNTSPNFPKITEIEQGGKDVAVLRERIVIGDVRGAAWIYGTDGRLVKTLEQDASSSLWYGSKIAITYDKVIVGVAGADNNTGAVFIYSAVTGEFIEKVVAPDGGSWDWFGASVCASDSYFIAGAPNAQAMAGAAYLFQFSE